MGNPTKKNSGIALIVVTALLALILGIILGVVALNQAGGKHVAYFRDREIAFNIAKAGIENALYDLNYGSYPSGAYPTTGNFFPAPVSFEGGTYTVSFEDSGTINEDKITSVGTYSGRIRTISVKIRGDNTGGSALNTSTYGIVEAFNKHAVYADTFTYNSGTVNGNITAVNPANLTTLTVTGNNTKVRIASADFDDATTPLALDTAANSWGITLPGSFADFSDLPAAGPITVSGITASYDGPDGIGTDTYTFTGQTINTDIRVRGKVVISGGTASAYVVADDNDASVSSDLTCNATLSSGAVLYAEDSGTITLTYSADASAKLFTNGTITLNSNATNTLTGDIVGGNITINGNIITGSVVATGNITLTNALSQITPADNKGAIMASGNITIDNYAHAITGLVYANGNITVSGGTVNGCLVSKGTLDLTNATITYSSTNYTTYPNATFTDGVYAHFSGGRRVYIPVIDSWREE